MYIYKPLCKIRKLSILINFNILNFTILYVFVILIWFGKIAIFKKIFLDLITKFIFKNEQIE